MEIQITRLEDVQKPRLNIVFVGVSEDGDQTGGRSYIGILGPSGTVPFGKMRVLGNEGSELPDHSFPKKS